MEILYSIIDTTLRSFDFAYCIIVNLLTYFVIKIINKPINTWQKRIVLLCMIFTTGGVYYIIGNDTRVIINSAILAPVFWSWILKPICIKFRIDYKKYDIFNGMNKSNGNNRTSTRPYSRPKPLTPKAGYTQTRRRYGEGGKINK